MKKIILFLLFGVLLILTNACSKSEPAPTPTANFTFAPANPTTQDEVVFTGTAQNAKTYSWSSSPSALNSTQLTARQRFATAGTYQVTFTATGDGGSTPVTKTVTVVEPRPTVDFTFSIASPITRQPVNITTTVQNGSSFAWSSSPAGFTSTQQNPTFSFATTGTYTITLLVTGNGGTTSVNKTITVAAPTLRADFSISNTNPIANDVVIFTDRSTGGARTFVWTSTPDEGFNSTDQNPRFTFRNSGMKTVNLVVTDEFGNTASRNTTIVVQRRYVGTLVALTTNTEVRGSIIATTNTTTTTANANFYLGMRDAAPFVNAGSISANGQNLTRNTLTNVYTNTNVTFTGNISWVVGGANDIPATNFNTNKPIPIMPNATFPTFTSLDKTNGFTIQLSSAIACDELEVFVFTEDQNLVRIGSFNKSFPNNSTTLTITGAELASLDDRFSFTILIEARNISLTETEGKSYIARNVASRVFTYRK